MMRCKVGDLAVRIKAFEDSVIPVGAVLRCISYEARSHILFGSRGITSPVDGSWSVDWNGKTGRAGFDFGVPDEHLQPIGNPGDDARDESLSWLPVPSREEVSV